MRYLLIILLPLTSFASRYVTYCYPEKGLKIVVDAEKTNDDGFKKAASMCFMALTKNKYPGEQEGLKIIDICANPKPCKGD